MDPKTYWQQKLTTYSADKPTIFATQVIKHFPPKASILELGAGLGQDSRYFSQNSFAVTATDLIESVNVKPVDLNQPLPFTPNSFDIVYAHQALQFFDTKRTQKLFDEIYQILKPGGVLAILVNSLADPEISQSSKIADDLYLTPSGLTKRFFSVDSLKNFTQKFETILLDDHGSTHKDPLPNLIRFVGKKTL